jgi:hypothetical protein
MDNLMPHMISDVEPLVNHSMISFSTEIVVDNQIISSFLKRQNSNVLIIRT